VYAFASPDASDQPPYRTVPRGWARGKDYYNNFGFRGPDIVPRKSERVVRVAFLGSSVTAAGWPFSYPEYVVHYLRQWARANKLDVDFDLVNAARVGVSMGTMAQIMRYEVAPPHPDIVVLYDGGEYLWGLSIVETADGATAFSKPSVSVSVDVQYRPFEQYSAFLSRLYQFFGHGTGMETPKPAHTLNFDLTQKNPDIDREDLPFDLHGQIADIRDAANTTRSVGGEFFLTSYVGMVQDRLRLDPVRHKSLLDILNVRYFPMTYREFRQSFAIRCGDMKLIAEQIRILRKIPVDVNKRIIICARRSRAARCRRRPMSPIPRHWRGSTSRRSNSTSVAINEAVCTACPSCQCGSLAVAAAVHSPEWRSQ
jgi:hypothetical protein